MHMDLTFHEPNSHTHISNIKKQRVKINNSCSLWSDILSEVSKASAERPLLFNILLCDLLKTTLIIIPCTLLKLN